MKQHMDYWSIIQGALRKKADENDPEAKMRKYKTKEGEEKTVYEVVKAGVSGYIDNVKIHDGKFGKQLLVYIKDVEEFCIQMPWDSSEAMSFCEKLRNVDVAKEVEILPYDFIPKGKTKARRGVNLIQGETKLFNYYVEFDAMGNVVGHKGGYPTVEADQMDSDDWKIHFAKVRKFLKDDVVEAFPFLDVNEGANEGATGKATGEAPVKDDLPFIITALMTVGTLLGMIV